MTAKEDMNVQQSPAHHAPDPSDKPSFWVSQPAAKLVLITLHVVALLAVLIEWIWPFNPDAHAVERVHALDFTGSYALYGFFACVILVLLGLILRRLVMRPETYYPDDTECRTTPHD